MIQEIKQQCEQLFSRHYRDMGIYLVRFDGVKGIVKCDHIEKDNTIKLIKSIDTVSSYKVNIETLGTSGTIKALIRKHM